MIVLINISNFKVSRSLQSFVLSFVLMSHQVVVNPLLRRESPVHDAMFESLAALQADYVRYVPW